MPFPKDGDPSIADLDLSSAPLPPLSPHDTTTRAKSDAPSVSSSPRPPRGRLGAGNGAPFDDASPLDDGQAEGPQAPLLPSSDGNGKSLDNPLRGPSSLPGPASAAAATVSTPGKNSESPKPREALNREMYRIPSYSGWFSWSKIHTIERRALSEFFDGRSLSKTPKIYKEYRDFMINRFRENPRRALNFTEVRKMLIGDVNCIRKVFDFLEYWGLINFQVPADGKHLPTTVESSTATLLEQVPRSVRVINPGSVLGSSRAVAESVSVEKSAGAQQAINLATYKDAFASTASAAATEASEDAIQPEKCACRICQVDCTNRRFESSKKAGFTLCPNCFTPANLGEGFSMDDFTEKETDLETQPKVENWTQQETLLLLEAITQHGEDWNLVANHVGTKSKTQCILHFIRLPFGDQFLSNIGPEPPSFPITTETSNVKMSELKGNGVGGNPVLQKVGLIANGGHENLDLNEDVAGPPAKRKRLTPLADASNPIMAQVAFLSTMVGPRVAAAAAAAAVAALAEEDPTASQILYTNTHNSQSSHKDFPQASNFQAGSGKESGKMDLVEKEELQVVKGGQEQAQLPKEVDSDNGNAIPPKDSLPSITQIRAGISTALGAAAANAKLLADQEEREIEHLMASIIENQLKKMQSKVEHFEELEFLLEREHIQIEQARTQVLTDRIQFAQYQFNAGPS